MQPNGSSSGDDPSRATPPEAQHAVDSGDAGCGDVTLILRHELKTVEPGAVVAVRSRDPAVADELPAWCRMTGHHFIRTVVVGDAQVHYIRKKTG